MHIKSGDPQAARLQSILQNGDVQALQEQLSERPELAAARIVDTHGVSRTLLHVVADWPGHIPNGAQLVAELVSAGAEVDAGVVHPVGTGAPETALHWAASSDDVPVLNALLDNGANIEAPGAVFTNGTAMSDAVVFAQWNAAHQLLARGANTTIWQAAALGLVDRVQSFCASTPAPSTRDLTNALWHACRGGQQEVAALLMERGADVNWIGHDQKTPLDAAFNSGDRSLVEALRAHGAKRAREFGN